MPGTSCFGIKAEMFGCDDDSAKTRGRINKRGPFGMRVKVGWIGLSFRRDHNGGRKVGVKIAAIPGLPVKVLILGGSKSACCCAGDCGSSAPRPEEVNVFRIGDLGCILRAFCNDRFRCDPTRSACFRRRKSV